MKTRSTPHLPKTVGKLHHFSHRLLIRADFRRKTLLFKTNKTKNTTIKNSNQSGGDDGHWPVLACFGGDGQQNTLADGQNWIELLYMAEKHLKKHTK